MTSRHTLAGNDPARPRRASQVPGRSVDTRRPFQPRGSPAAATHHRWLRRRPWASSTWTAWPLPDQA